MRFIVVGLLLVVMLAGCTSSEEEPLVVTDPPCAFDGSACLGPPPRVVVAVIDSGVDVYHDFFHQGAPVPQDLLAEFTYGPDGAAPRTLHITTQGSYDERLAADEELWRGVEEGVLYHFAGTRVLGISFDAGRTPFITGAGHGTATSASVLTANPDAIVVMVQGVGNAEGELWAASQDWIDILSESYGPIGSVFGTGPVLGLSTAEQNRIAWLNGKLPVGAADNSPAPAPQDETAGPPWVLGVAGDHPESSCRETFSGNLPDFTADYTQELPRAGTLDEVRPISGTSFSTPMVAGVASRILLDVRITWGHLGGITEGALALGPDGPLSNAGLREAMNRTATYFATETGCVGGQDAPTFPAAPWLQSGWGHVGPEMVEPAVQHLLGEEAADKPAAAVATMDALYAYRTALWSTR
jgi:hypothetical protein